MRVKADGASHGLLPAQRPNSPLPADQDALRMLQQAGASAAANSGAASAPTTGTPLQQQLPAGQQEAPEQIHAAGDGAALSEDAATAGALPADALLERPPSQASLGPPQRTRSPKLHAKAARAGSRASSPPSRPLSPLGKVIKSEPSRLRRSAPPDLSRVRSRYLEGVASAEQAGGSGRSSPSRQAAHGRHYLWRLGKLHADVPDYKASQPRLYGNEHCLGTGSAQDVVTLKQVRAASMRGGCASIREVADRDRGAGVLVV